MASSRTSRNPVAIIFVPVAMLIAAQARLAHQRVVGFAAFAPAPAYRAEMVATGGLIANGADDAFGQSAPVELLFLGRIRIANVTVDDAHSFT